MNFHSFLDTLILLGALQGFITGFLLCRSEEKYAGKIIGWLLLILATACLKVYLNNIGLLSSQIGSLIDAFVPFMIIMAIGPLIYFYCKSELSSGFRIQKKDRIHFYPVIIDLFQHASALIFLVVLLLGWANPRQNNFGQLYDSYNVYADVPRWISLTIYLYFSFKLVKAYSKNQYSNSEPRTSWLMELLWVFFAFDILWLCYLVPYVIPSLTDKMLGWFDWYPIYLPLVLVIYWLGIRSLMINRHSLSLMRKNGKQLPKESIDKMMPLLQKSMTEEKLYRDPELTLTKLATHLNLSSKLISAAINQQSGKSFNEYVNHFRVEEFKTKLIQTENKKFTITALAFECGFNSQPTFQRAFKNIAGITPTEFAERHNTVA
ncbi:MAG TPA: AraC family transcriptional regulator [Cytophagales bacterium]|jgi:AraC-like DNA-binding protein|nr:AraC family transcriptional regulator [Cytophagales bacterium]